MAFGTQRTHVDHTRQTQCAHHLTRRAQHPRGFAGTTVKRLRLNCGVFSCFGPVSKRNSRERSELQNCMVFPQVQLFSSSKVSPRYTNTYVSATVVTDDLKEAGFAEVCIVTGHRTLLEAISLVGKAVIINLTINLAGTSSVQWEKKELQCSAIHKLKRFVFVV